MGVSPKAAARCGAARRRGQSSPTSVLWGRVVLGWRWRHVDGTSGVESDMFSSFQVACPALIFLLVTNIHFFLQTNKQTGKASARNSAERHHTPESRAAAPPVHDEPTSSPSTLALFEFNLHSNKGQWEKDNNMQTRDNLSLLVVKNKSRFFSESSSWFRTSRAARYS